MRIAPPRAWHRGEWLIVPSDTGLAWEEALRVATSDAVVSGFGLIQGEIGRIDAGFRFHVQQIASKSVRDWEAVYLQEPRGLEPPKRWRRA